MPVCRGKGYVGVRTGNMVVVSCYVSPNVDIFEFEDFLEELTIVVKNLDYKYLIIAGDFNAKSRFWGSLNTNKRGEILEEWADNLDMRLSNMGNSPTCIRATGSSIVDVTWTTPNLTQKVYNWHVVDDCETFSDHQYIRYDIILESKKL